MTYRNEKWLNAVRSISLCVRCGRYGVQAAHRNEGKGMGQKTGDHLTAALCPPCHHELDNGKTLTREDRRAEMDRAIVQTRDVLVQLGRIKLVDNGGK